MQQRLETNAGLTEQLAQVTEQTEMIANYLDVKEWLTIAFTNSNMFAVKAYTVN